MIRLQRRHYKMIARVVASIKDPVSQREAAYAFVEELKYTNPNFDQDMFLTACGVDGPEPSDPVEKLHALVRLEGW
jgi:hypothetical protein